MILSGNASGFAIFGKGPLTVIVGQLMKSVEWAGLLFGPVSITRMVYDGCGGEAFASRKSPSDSTTITKIEPPDNACGQIQVNYPVQCATYIF